MKTTIIGDAIHGGEILVQREVDNMYPYLPSAERAKYEVALIAEARKAFSWAPRKLAATYGQTNTDYHYYLTVTLTVPVSVRKTAVEARLKAAESTRCACGSYGSWDDSISGTSGDAPCVWAGCSNCSGQAIGRPILASDLAWYERRAKAVR